jgi:RNA polymerase sigma-B factor
MTTRRSLPPGCAPRGSRGTDPVGVERAVFARHRRCPDPAVREALIERFLPLARHVAARYDGPGRSHDDIFQVACVGLVKAIDRFDPGRGVAFSSYAVPTLVGEIKRYFRDQTWAVHVTRDLQERTLRTARAVRHLARQLGREPTVSEVAALMGYAEGEVLEARHAASAYTAASLEARERGREGTAELTLDDTIGCEDERLARVEQRVDLWSLVDRLTRRERAVLWLRFERDLTQSEIAAVLGVSQVEVSRTLRRAIQRLQRLESARAAA